MLPFFQGFGIGAGLIIAIGAQNSFVLTQGVRKQHIYLIPLICSICDIILIIAGAAGIGSIVASYPKVSYYAGIAGAFFLFWYGLKSLMSVFDNAVLDTSKNQHISRRAIIFTTLAITFLNPHVYLDTILMLGTISGQFEGLKRFIFAIGACSASTIWFFSLSLGGSLLEPLFRKPLSWKILDLSICVVMWSIAWSIWP
jgi:L-lysine exporter family protein LysE/ArgO